MLCFIFDLRTIPASHNTSPFKICTPPLQAVGLVPSLFCGCLRLGCARLLGTGWRRKRVKHSFCETTPPCLTPSPIVSAHPSPHSSTLHFSTRHTFMHRLLRCLSHDLHSTMLLQCLLFLPLCCHLSLSRQLSSSSSFSIRGQSQHRMKLCSTVSYDLLVTIMHTCQLLDACNHFLDDLTPDPSFFAVLLCLSFFSSFLLCAPSWQLSSAETRQHLRQLLLVPILHFLSSFNYKGNRLMWPRFEIFHHLHLRIFPLG